MQSLTISGAQASQFSLVAPPSTPFPVAPAGSQGIAVRCTPTSLGPKSATLTVGSDADGGTNSVSLQCNGVAPDIDVSPTLLAFGAQRVGTTSSGQTLTISNTATGPGAGSAPATKSASTVCGARSVRAAWERSGSRSAPTEW